MLLAALLAVLALCACGGSNGKESSTEDGSDASISKAPSSSGTKDSSVSTSNTSWTWGAANGMSGNAEYTFNEQGFVAGVKLYNGATGALYRELVYSYDNEDSALTESGCASSLMTLDGGGNTLYNLSYIWAPCERENGYYISYAYGYDYVLEESCSNFSYQELSHLVLSSSTSNMMGKSAYYWITEWNGSKRVETHIFAKEGREDEDLRIVWEYDGEKLTGAKIGRYEKYYEASAGENNSITLTLDESHQSETKALTQFYTYTIENTADGKPACYSYHFYKEYENTSEPDDETDSLTFIYENGTLASVVCVQETNGYPDRTFRYDTAGNLISEDTMQSVLGKGEVGACSYEYYDNGIVSAMSMYHDFTTEDPSAITETWRYDETGHLSAKEYVRDGLVYKRESYNEAGSVVKKETFSQNDDGSSYPDASTSYDEFGNTTEKIRYWEDGSIYTQEVFNEHDMYTYRYCAASDGVVSYEGKMTGDNEYTEIWYNKDGSISEKYVYTYDAYYYGYVRYDGNGSEIDRKENKAYKR